MENCGSSEALSFHLVDTRWILRAVLLPSFLLLVQFVYAQHTVTGTVYDYSGRMTLEGVQIRSTSGDTVRTDIDGRYSIAVSSADSISFFYFDKETEKFGANALTKSNSFDIRLQMTVDALPTIYFRPNSYRADSVANRSEYKKAFDYMPDWRQNPASGAGISLSTDLLLSGRKIKQMKELQKRLKQEETDAYIDSRFNRTLVKRLTGLQSPALDSFMIQYRPTKEMLQQFEADYDYYRYIRDAGRSFAENWMKDHPDDSEDNNTSLINQ